ncbi:hypothetical protein RUR49_07240 [Pseudoxanthobacter sp. M-2]|uniref:hypothetical protein n=1 Tax=Pseudoxanthobacter sp. M-2 TaxID=3078754 RepID=UPI0038FBF4D1
MLYVHIGLHKTGTSTIQRFFRLNTALTERHGLAFPDLGFDSRTHGGVIAALRDIEKGDASGEAVFEAIDRLADVDGRSYLLSTENFELMPPRRIEMFAERIRRRHDVRVLAYVRDLTRLMPSVYAQRTKKGRNLRDIDTFFAMTEDWKRFRVSELIGRWGEVFGWDKVRVRPLDREALNGGDLVSDAVAAVGLPPPVIEEAPAGTRETFNASPPWEAVETLRAIYAAIDAAGLDWDRLGRSNRVQRKTFSEPGGEQGVVYKINRLEDACAEAAVAAGGGGRVQYLTPEQWSALRALYMAEIEKLNAHLDQPIVIADERAPGERPFLPAYAEIGEPVRRAMAERLLGGPPVTALPQPVADVVRQVLGA